MRSIGMDCMILFGRAPTAEKVMQTRSHSGFNVVVHKTAKYAV